MKRMVLIAIAVTLVIWAPPWRASAAGSAGDSTETEFQPAADEPGVKSQNSITLQEAIDLALAQNPDLLGLRSGMGLARARMVTAAQWPFNPELGFEYEGDDLTDNEGSREWKVGLFQAFELGGQRGWRKRSAKSGEVGAAAELRQAEWELRAMVTTAFYRLLFLNQSAELAKRRLEVAHRLVEVAEARLAGQQVPELEVNLVRLEFHQAANARKRVARRQRVAQVRLAWLLGLGRVEVLTVSGEFEARERPEPDTSALVQRAISSRGDLAALRAGVEGANFRVRLEKSAVWPGTVVGLFYKQEEEPISIAGTQEIQRDRLLGIDVSFPLPLLNRRGGEIREAEAKRDVARARLDALERTVRREVTEAAEILRLVTETLTIYEAELNRLSEQNLVDIERAFEAGEVGAIQVLRAQDDFVGVTQGYYDALFEYHEAAAALAATVGPPRPETERPAEQEGK